MEYIRTLDSLRKEDVTIAGGKAASLGELIKAGIPVPPGFVILADAEINNDQILAAFDDLGVARVAVRSSATMEDGKSDTWAGQLDSFLHIEREELLQKIQICRSGLNSSRAQAYRNEKGIISHTVFIPVIVQKMVDAEKAGVAFSVDPVTENRNTMIIEAINGLGENLVSGKIIPDLYTISKNPLSILSERSLSQVALLSKIEIVSLAKLILTIENQYGFPCDIEWAFEKGRFFIVQCRPITTLGMSSNSVNQYYQQTFSSEDYTVMNTSFLYDAGYLAQGGVAMCENNFLMSIYIKEIDLPAYGEIGYRIFSSTLETQKHIADTEALIMALNKTKDFVVPNSILILSDLKLADLFKKCAEMNTAFLSLYRLLETHFTFKAEKIINEYIEKEQIFEGKTAFDLIYDESLIIEDDAICELCKNVRTLAAFKLRMNKESDVLFQTYILLLREIKKRFKLTDQEDIRILSWQEIYNFISDGFSYERFRQIKEKRGNSFLIEVNILGKKNVSESVEAQKQITFIKSHTFDHHDGSDEKMIYGQIACKGKHVGRAIVLPYITSDSDEQYRKSLEDFKKGDILVTKNTVPEIMELISKVSAIVTEEGGITCHGAVIAREFNIPAIVGVTNATSVIKSGDTIEVDAINGNVRLQQK